MNIGFLIQRNTYYKFFGSIIDEALRKGHRVFCFHDYAQPQTGKKAYQFPHLRGVPRFLNGQVVALSYQNEDDLITGAKHNQVEVFVSLHFVEQYLSLRNKAKASGIKWVSLQHGLDSLVSAQYLAEPDLYLFYSKTWFDFASKYSSSVKGDKIKFVGFSELDQAKLVNPYKVKEKWGIPENQKVVLFLPFPFGATNDKFWSRFIFGKDLPFLQFPLALKGLRFKWVSQILKRQNDPRFCSLLKDFCRKNDAFLLVKSRKKDPVRTYLRKIADKVLYDEQEYPSTIIECLSIADLCLNFVSTAVTESVSLGVYNLSVLPQEGYKDIDNPLWKLLLGEYRDLFDFEGATKLVSLADAFSLLKEKSLADFVIDKQAKEVYCKKYIGSGEPSKKAVEEIERLVG